VEFARNHYRNFASIHMASEKSENIITGLTFIG